VVFHTVNPIPTQWADPPQKFQGQKSADVSRCKGSSRAVGNDRKAPKHHPGACESTFHA